MMYSCEHVWAHLAGGPRRRRATGLAIWWCVLPAVALAAGAQTTAMPPESAESHAGYATDLRAFLAEADATYPFFDLKGIRADWEKEKARLLREVETCASDADFLGLARDAIGCLRDGHMYIRDARAALPPVPPEYYPGISFMPASQNRVIVIGAIDRYPGLKPGTIVTKIDGEDARTFLDARAAEGWTRGYVSSPQRARLFAYRIPLRGEKDKRYTLAFESDGNEWGLMVVGDIEARGWPHTYNLPEGMVRVGRSFLYAQLPSGVGYMYLRRVDDSVTAGMREAMEKCPDACGWIVDLRGNGGGGYGADLIACLEALPKPVAGLIDAGCVSAGETLARDLVRCAEARLFGTRTAGSSSSKRTWTFPSGIASVVFSTQSRQGRDGKPIEYLGIEPDEAVEPVPEEVAAGLNSCILRAEAYLRAFESHAGPAPAIP